MINSIHVSHGQSRARLAAAALVLLNGCAMTLGGGRRSSCNGYVKGEMVAADVVTGVVAGVAGGIVQEEGVSHGALLGGRKAPAAAIGAGVAMGAFLAAEPFIVDGVSGAWKSDCGN